MRSDEDDSESTESDSNYSDDEEDSDYSGYSVSDISEVDFEIKVFQDVTKLLNHFDKLELEEEVKSAAKNAPKKTEDPTLNNKSVSEDNMEIPLAKEEKKEDFTAASKTPDEDRKTGSSLPEDCLLPCYSGSQVHPSFLF